MRRHDFDWVSLIGGIVFTGIAVLYLVVAVTDVNVDARFVWPLVLVALGAAGIATAVSANLREEKRFAEVPASTTSSSRASLPTSPARSSTRRATSRRASRKPT